MDGFEFLQGLRKSSIVPVIIVSARESDEDRILGLGLGADDFVGKPFSPRELVARVRSQLRRAGYASVPKDGDETVRFGPFVLDPGERRLSRDGTDVALSRMEYEVLAHLASRPRVPVGAEELYSAVWGAKFGDLSTVAGHVRRLRLKIEDDPSNPRWVVTVHGFGYRFDPEGETQ
jgi:DNA-binding response OmpR family regulator